MDDSRDDIHTTGTPVVCRSCEARHRGICGALEPSELSRLAQHTSIRKIPAGAELLAEEEEPEGYANIMSGVVKLTKLMADGRQQIVGLQFAPDFLGRPFEKTSKVGAEAATDVKICAFPKSALDAMLVEFPKLELRMHQQTLAELDDARDWMLTLGRRTAEEKVANFLHVIAERYDPEASNREGPTTFDLPLSRADAADFLGLTIETVSRHITKLRKAGIIEKVGGRTMTVPDLDRLREIAGS